MAIRFFESGIISGLKEKRKLKAFLTQQLHHYLVLKKIDINFIFCDDEALLEKNIAFLQHHTLTDIITFDLSEKEDELLSEIYISTERVAENAIKFGVSYTQELHRVIFHGVLHLIGFGDKKTAEKEIMRQKENEWIALYQKFNPQIQVL